MSIFKITWKLEFAKWKNQTQKTDKLFHRPSLLSKSTKTISYIEVNAEECFKPCCALLLPLYTHFLRTLLFLFVIVTKTVEALN